MATGNIWVTEVTDRMRYTIIGLMSLVIFVALSALLIKFSFGAFDGGINVSAEFEAAGQGLSEESDVKIRGINTGRVTGIDVTDEGKARVSMKINEGQSVPAGAMAVIRPKTLFGEKFVDIVIDDDVRAEVLGFDPFDDPAHPCNVPPAQGELADGAEIACTVSGFELERVLADAFPVIAAIDPAELETVIGTFATAADGLGETVNRSIALAPALTQQAVRQDRNTRQFLGDFADIAQKLNEIDDDLLATAADLNEVLPRLNVRSDQLASLLDQTARLTGDLATLFEANTGYTQAAFTDGSKNIDLLFRNRQALPGLVEGLRKFVQLQTDVIRIPVQEGPTIGTLMAAVRGVTAPEAGDLDVVNDLIPGLFPDPAGAGPASQPDAPGPLAGDLVPLVQELLGL